MDVRFAPLARIRVMRGRDSIKTHKWSAVSGAAPSAPVVDKGGGDMVATVVVVAHTINFNHLKVSRFAHLRRRG